MNTFQLTCFIAVANTLSFARAAESLHVTQPAVTHQIKVLEQELGVPLLHRSTRSVTLTPDGQVFLEDAKNIVAMEMRAKRRFLQPGEDQRQVLRIGCCGISLMLYIQQAMADMREQFTNLSPVLRVLPCRQIYSALERGDLDVALTLQEERPAGNLIYRELGTSPMICLQVGKGNDPVTVEQLSKEQLIFCDPTAAVPAVSNLQWRLIEGRTDHQVHYCDSPEAAIVLSGSGFGVTVMPQVFLPSLISNALTTAVIQDAPPVSFGLYYQPGEQSSQQAAFIRLMEQQFKK